MFKFLANWFRQKPAKEPAPGNTPGIVSDEHTPIYKELAMTEELREALFPKTNPMVSALFDRDLPPLHRQPPSPPPAAKEGDFPIIF